MMDVVQRVKLQQCAQGVEHELAVAMGIHPYAATTLEVDDLDYAVRHDDQIAGAESLRDVLAVVQFVFHHDQRIRAGGADCLDGFNAEGNVFIRDAFGLVRAELAVTMLGILRFHDFCGHIAQIAMQLQLAQFMEKCALFRIGRRLIFELLRELHRGRAHHPAVGRRGVQPGMGAAAVLDLARRLVRHMAHSAATSFFTASY